MTNEPAHHPARVRAPHSNPRGWECKVRSGRRAASKSQNCHGRRCFSPVSSRGLSSCLAIGARLQLDPIPLHFLSLEWLIFLKCRFTVARGVTLTRNCARFLCPCTETRRSVANVGRNSPKNLTWPQGRAHPRFARSARPDEPGAPWHRTGKSAQAQMRLPRRTPSSLRVACGNEVHENSRKRRVLCPIRRARRESHLRPVAYRVG